MKLIRLMITMSLMLFIVAITTKIAGAYPIYKMNQKFSNKGLNLKGDYRVIDYKNVDVNGDKIKDNVILIGVHMSEIAYDDVTIIIQDGKDNKFTRFSPGENPYGYSPDLFLGDFNGDKVKDIMVRLIDIRGISTLTYSIFAYKDNRLVTLFSQEMSKGITFSVKYMDNYKLNVYSYGLKKSFIINVKGDKRYNNSLYKNGKLIGKFGGGAYEFTELTPIDIDKDGVYELKGLQIIAGYSHSVADMIAEARSTLKWDNPKGIWRIKKLQVLPIIPY